MAKRNYASHGNTAFAPDRKSGAVRRTTAPQRGPQKVPQPKPSLRPITRKRVLIREADFMSIDAIVGYIAVASLATLLMMGQAKLTTSADEVVQLRSELSSLNAERVILSAEYEKQFDIQRIEDVLGNDMMRPTSEQVVYIDLSQPDSVNVYGKAKEDSVGFFEAFRNIFS